MGVSVRNTAFSCRCSTATVRAVTTRAKAHGLEWPLPEEMNDAAIRAVIYPAKERSDMSKAEIDHPRIDKEMNRPGMTMLTLWREYCEDALASGMEPYLYSAFCQKHRAWAAANKVSMRIERKPAQEMQVDYVGDTMEVLDADTGEARKVYVFVACLPYSGEMFAEGAYNMRAESWVEAHVHAFAFFGGSVPIVVPDNLKQGVVKNTVEELVINEQYRRMAEYYGCAVVPARPRRPRDKGAVEMSVRVIEQRAIAPLRNQLFTSLRQLNEALLEKVREIMRVAQEPVSLERAAGMRSSSAKRSRCSSRCRASPTRWLPARLSLLILTTTSRLTDAGTRFRSATSSARWSYAPPDPLFGWPATASESPCTSASTALGEATAPTPTTCPIPIATLWSGTRSASVNGRPGSARPAGKPSMPS